MPSRALVVVIATFWVGTCGWLFCRDVLPWLQAGEAPRLFHADFADEVRRTEVRWFVYRDKNQIGAPVSKRDRIGSGTSVTERNPDRSYSLSTHLVFSRLDIPLARIAGLGLGVNVQKISSTCTVGPREDLVALGSEVTLDIGTQQIVLAMSGHVKDDSLAARLSVRGLGQSFDQKLDPVKVSARGGFLNPMHLLSRVPDPLHEGQSWPVPVIDPLGDAALAFVAKYLPIVKLMGPALSTRLEKLYARVASAVFERDGSREECWAIDYHRDPGKPEIFARTWVRKSDQWIVCQEASFQGRRLVIARVFLSPGLPR